MKRLVACFITSVVLALAPSTIQAKLFDLSAILSGDFEAGDTLAASVNVSMPTTTSMADTRPIRQSSVRPEVVVPVQDKTPTAGNLTVKKKAAEEDDADVAGPVLSGETLSGGFSFPSFTSSSVSYSSDISVVRSSITNPSQAMSYMQTNFSYSAHGSDTPYTPEELNNTRAGDCKDFSTFFSWAIADDGYEAPIYVFQYGEKQGHVVSIYNNGDGWYVQSNLNSYGPINSAMDGMQMAAAYNLPAGTSVGKYREFSTGYVGKLAYE
jgi:hypothetical protein